MKVTEIKSFPITDDDGRLYFIVKVETDSGIYGLGEVGIARWGAAIGKAIDHLSQIVIGQDPFSTENYGNICSAAAFSLQTRSIRVP